MPGNDAAKCQNIANGLNIILLVNLLYVIKPMQKPRDPNFFQQILLYHKRNEDTAHIIIPFLPLLLLNLSQCINFSAIRNIQSNPDKETSPCHHVIMVLKSQTIS